MLRLSLLAFLLVAPIAIAVEPPPIITDVDIQPLAANAERLTKALEFLGTPMPKVKEDERAEAEKTFQKAIGIYRKIAEEAGE